MQDETSGSKSIESIIMYCDAYQRLASRNCEKVCLQNQLKSLGEALGPHKPSPQVADDDFNVDGESLNCAQFEWRDKCPGEDSNLTTSHKLAPDMPEHPIKVGCLVEFAFVDSFAIFSAACHIYHSKNIDQILILSVL